MKAKKFKKIYVEITNVCNLSCPFCLELKRERQFMDFLKFEEIIRKVKDYTDYLYLHIKGEPLIHPHFNRILGACAKNNLLVNLTTNGTLIKENYQTLIESSTIRQINISTHSFSEFAENKQREYLDEVIKLVKYAEKEGEFYISLRFWLGNNQLQNFAISYLESELNVKIVPTDKAILRNVYVSFDSEFVWPEAETNTSDFVYCHGIKDHIGILVDGTVVPCCLDGNGVINLGNLFTSSLEEILSSPRYLKMLKALETRKMEEELCLRCSFKNRFR